MNGGTPGLTMRFRSESAGTATWAGGSPVGSPPWVTSTPYVHNSGPLMLWMLLPVTGNSAASAACM